jgi:hypothetical protein
MLLLSQGHDLYGEGKELTLGHCPDSLNSTYHLECKARKSNPWMLTQKLLKCNFVVQN